MGQPNSAALHFKCLDHIASTIAPTDSNSRWQKRQCVNDGERPVNFDFFMENPLSSQGG